jgi:hypothetical protein
MEASLRFTKFQSTGRHKYWTAAVGNPSGDEQGPEVPDAMLDEKQVHSLEYTCNIVNQYTDEQQRDWVLLDWSLKRRRVCSRLGRRTSNRNSKRWKGGPSGPEESSGIRGRSRKHELQPPSRQQSLHHLQRWDPVREHCPGNPP